MSVVAWGQLHTVSAVPELADFSTLEEAIDNANAGDTIYVYPGNYNLEGGLTKPLAIVGPGYRRSENGLVSDNLNTGSAQFSNFNILLNLNGAASISGCLISSINIVAAADVKIERCYISRNIEVASSSNIVLRQNFIYADGASSLKSDFEGVDGLVFYNNIFNRRDTFRVDEISSSLIMHNVFGSSSRAFVINNSMVKNNVFEFRNAISLSSINNSIVDHNIKFNGSCFGTNCQVYSSLVFVSPEGISFDGQYQLSANSTARGAGVNGVDCGVFGGDFPYQLSGLPPIPLIYDLDMPDNAQTGTPLNVNVKVKAQN